MLITAFSMSMGFFMLIPLVSVHYTESLGFTASMVGLALAVRQFSQQGLMLLTGSLAERVGYRPVLATGMIVRSLGFATFVVADTLPRLLLASFVAAVGGAFFEVSARSLHPRPNVFPWHGRIYRPSGKRSEDLLAPSSTTRLHAILPGIEI